MKIKFLIIRFSSIGDIVLTSPVVRCLRNKFPDAEIHYLTKKRNVDLLSANPYINKIHLLDSTLSVVIQELKKEKYDYIIDLHNNIRSFRVKAALQTISFSFRKLNLHKFLLTFFKINTLPDRHIVDRNMATLNHFGVQNDGKGLDYFIHPEDEFVVESLPDPFKEGYIALVLAGTYTTKKMPVEKYRSLITQSPYPFILLGGKNEQSMAAVILSWNTHNILDFTGKLTINQSASLIKYARLVISNDTGLMHIAAAYHKKILSVWGNTVPEFGMSPYLPGDGSEILEVKGLSCRPCSKLGYNKCPKGHFKCMYDQSEHHIIHWTNREFPL
ncbi:MAG: glycosyltransferase family 9 protein [Candidatus Saccharibacteria bacterium]